MSAENKKYRKRSIISVGAIVLTLVAVILIGALIPMNIVLSYYAPTLHMVFGGSSAGQETSQAAEEALAAGDEMVQELAEDSMVLLRNESSLGESALPLKEEERAVNLFGFGATDDGFLLTGKGSGGSTINDSKKVTLTKAFTYEGFSVNTELTAAYNSWRASAGGYIDADVNGSSSMRPYNPSESFYTDSLMDQAKSFSGVAIVVLSRYTGENSGDGEAYNVSADGASYNNGAWLELTTEERAMFEAIAKADFDKVIVLLNTTNAMELGFLENEAYGIDAAMYIGLPGQSGARAVPRLLKGEKTVKDVDGNESTVQISPSGKLADTYAYDWQSNNPVMNNLKYEGYSGISKMSVRYAEGIYMGYRWYETADAEGVFDGVSNEYGSGYDAVVQYPFGYGMSYTTFEWTVTQTPASTMLEETGEYTVKVTVENTGAHAGSDVVELYYTPPYTDGSIEKAHRNLLDFAKTGVLQPGETEEVTLSFSAYDMASFDDYSKNDNGWFGYELEEGDYMLELMTDAHTVATVDGTQIANGRMVLEAAEDVLFLVDPDNPDSDVVLTRFTGEDAYAGVPIDGSTVHSSTVYLSRENGFANLSQMSTSSTGPNNDGAIEAAAKYRYTGYDGRPQYDQGKSGDMTLFTVNGSKPSLGDLNGSTGASLSYNSELFATLADYDAPEWEALLDQVTDDEICDTIGMGGFQTIALESVGKPRRADYDGPAGFGQNVLSAGSPSKWTAYPVEALIGCCWNKDLMFRMGRTQGKEGSETNANGWYAPGVNLHRSPYNTRNFEYYSEDPILSGNLSANLIYGAKTNNLYCYIKHFGPSDSGQNANDRNTWLTEQALREIYLKPFEIAVKRGGANAIMSCFNRVGAVWAGANHALVTEVLRDEWGFRGTVITDWYDASYMDHMRGVLAGNDLWLTPTAAAANIDMSNNAIAYAGRMAVKNVLYTMVDTYNTAVEYAAGGGEGGVDLNATTAATAAFSPLFMFLWVLLDAIFIIGVLLCGLFIFLKVRKRLRINAEIEAGTYSPRKNERSSARSAKNEVEMRLREYDPDWYEYK